MRNNNTMEGHASVSKQASPAPSHEKKSSENGLLTPLSTTIFSFVELVDMMPADDPRCSLLRMISDRLEDDLIRLRREISSH